MSFHIDVDPIRCEAHGLCAELLPERITLDEWGYPLVDPAPIPAPLEGLARRTVSACPTLALRLRAAASDARGGGAPPRASRSRTAG
ncbi:MAG TPA: ferredoxin [Solirubrobacteraceae bacterium]|jgi:ferredoxin